LIFISKEETIFERNKLYLLHQRNSRSIFVEKYFSVLNLREKLKINCLSTYLSVPKLKTNTLIMYNIIKHVIFN